MTSAMIDPTQVTKIIQETAQSIILPRYRCLSEGDIREKRPGDLVTIADTEAEQELTRRLTGLLPGSVAVGEEGVAVDRAVLERLEQESPVWILDPVDGTANFAKGNDLFAVIVALVIGGQTVGGWIHDPLHDRTAVTERGSGAWCDDNRLWVPPSDGVLAEMTGTFGYRRSEALSKSVKTLLYQGSSAHDYLALLEGRMQFAYFRRLHPWDHAAGVLLHREAGGYNALMTGEPYQPLPNTSGLLLAPNQDDWKKLAAIIGQ